jgi:FkbH-like protein
VAGSGLTEAERRSLIDRLIGEGKSPEAAQELAALWTHDTASAAFVISRFNKIRSELNLTRCRVAFERSFTLEPLLPIIRAGALIGGIDLDVHIGPFNAYAQEILDPQSSLYSFNPDVIVLAVLTSDIAPELWGNARGSSAVEITIRRVVEHFEHLLGAFKAKSAAHVIVHLLEHPSYPRQGVLDAQIAESNTAAIEQINESIRQLARTLKGVYTLHYDELISRFGRLNWRDAVKWEVARMPIRAVFHRALAEEWLKFLHPLTGRTAKVAVVDLDNTMWGGIIGEDGLAGIKLGEGHPGAAYIAFQHALLDVRDRGVLLGICSKNNLAEILPVFERHPGMLLKLNDFSAVKVNWLDKATNLRSIASELDIGLDAVAFVDDNPVERQQIRTELPEVYVLELPSDPMGYADAVRAFPPFERLTVSQEDKRRSEYYRTQKQVSELKSKAHSKEEFYRSLQQRVRIESINETTLARAAQLTQKTNQFNLTTRRYNEQQLSRLTEEHGWRTYIIRVSDRYADNGFVGLALTQDSGHSCIIDTFLLSCRVIGRGVETALLSHIAQDARYRGIRLLRATFVPTARNQPASSFLADHGFALVEQGNGSTWELDLEEGDVRWPEWIEPTCAGSQRDE